MARGYEELIGAEGQRIFYRAERFGASRLFGNVPPQVVIDRGTYKLCDLSMSGLAVHADRTRDWAGAVGAEVPVELRLGNAVLQEGRGRVCRVEPIPSGEKVALCLTTGYFDIPRIVARYKEISLTQELDGRLAVAAGRVGAEYRRHCADVLHLLRRYRFALEKLNGAKDGGVLVDEGSIEDALFLCEERILPECRALWYRANELVRPVTEDPEALEATKWFTELVVTPELLNGPVWRQCYEKPLGYPGDYRVMDYVYSWRREGETPYGMLLHRIGLDGMESIAARMVMMQQTIVGVVAEQPGGAPVRIASLACGPAQEVVNYLRLGSLPRPVRFTLIDQDPHALSLAYHRAYPEAVRLAGRATVDCLQASFVQLLKADWLFERIGLQDVVYALGLVDYLGRRSARGLVAGLYGWLAPGGLLVIGNVKDTPRGFLWPAEFVCDWSLVYRNEADMRELVEGLEPASVEIKADPTDKVHFLFLRKPCA